jgi:hypothetical protein
MYDPDCATDSKVFVNGTRLPAADVDIHIRNEGPIDMGYYCEGFFASPWNGVNYLDPFNIADEGDGGELDELYVEVSPYDSDSYFPAFRGVVTGVGNAGGDTPEQLWKFRAQGPAFFLDKIPAGKSFQGDGSVYANALNYVQNKLDEKLPFQLDTIGRIEDSASDSDVYLFAQPEDYPIYQTRTEEGDDDETGFNPLNVPSIQDVLTDTGDLLGDDNSVVETQTLVPTSRKTFEKNKHTLADVVQWLSKTINALFYVTPNKQNSELRFYNNATIRDYDAHYLDGDITIIENDALSELSPLNTLTVNGKAADTLTEFGDTEVNISSDTFYQIKARHTPLYKNAGEVELEATTYTESGANTKAELQNEAQKLLRDRITEATAGDMQVMLHHPIVPHDNITALPTCNRQSTADVPPLTYTVSRVHHRIRASEQSTTKLNVGVAVKDDDITVIDTVKKSQSDE